MDERGVVAAGVCGAVEVPSSARGTEEYRTRMARLTRLPPVKFEMAQFMAKTRFSNEMELDACRFQIQLSI